ncbi:MAG: hypothetical protein AAF696_07560 [Bacteroidota bacterium]
MMKQATSHFLLLIVFASLQGQIQEKNLSPENSLGVDFYGSMIPFFVDDIIVLSNIHIGLSLDEKANHGPCMSMWSYLDTYRSYRFTGLGYQVGPDWDYLFLKLEAGILLEFLNRNMDVYEVELKKGGLVNYFRFHFGFRFKKRFAWGAILNWIPPTQAVLFTDIGPFRTRARFEDFYRAPNRHISPSFFVGISLN